MTVPGSEGRHADPAPAFPEVLSVCTRCRPEGWQGRDPDRPGLRLAEAIEAEALTRGTPRGFLRDVRCMSQCKRPCVMAFSHPEKFTYVFGDLDPALHASDVLDAFELYMSRSDGFMERFERPEIMRAGILGRIPPLLRQARLSEPRFDPMAVHADQAVLSDVLSMRPPWSHDLGLMLYAHGIDHSDYVARVAPRLRALGAVGTLLDVGAGAGQLGAALVDREGDWRALEPSRSMAALLRLRHPHLVIDSDPWEQASLDLKADTVLAANIGAPLQAPSRFLDWCRARARRRIIWVVPAQHGPRGLCLAGLLPPLWHGEDMIPGVEHVMAGLPAAHAPRLRYDVAWTFNVVVDDVEALGSWLAHRLGWAADDDRRPDLVARLADQAATSSCGYRLSVPKVSAVLVWDV